MKKLTAILFLLSLKLGAQQVAVQLHSLNVLYEGLDNPLSIVVSGVSSDKVVVRGDNMSISRKSGNQYIARVNTNDISRLAYLHVGYLRKNDTLWCDTLLYRIKKVPAPELRFGGLQSGCYTRTQVIIQQQLLAYMEGFVFEGVSFKIDSAKLLIVGVKGSRQFNLKGPEIPRSARALFKDAFYICFNSVQASYASNLIKKLTPVEIYIRNDKESDCVSSLEVDDFSNPGRTVFHQNGRSYELIHKSVNQSGRIVDVYETRRIAPDTFLISERWFIDSSCIHHQEWFENGQPKLSMTFYDSRTSMDSIGNYQTWFENGKPRQKGRVYRADYRPDFRSSAHDIQRFHYLYIDSTEKSYQDLVNLVPTGKWEEFYENGNKKLEGSYSHYYGEDNGDYFDFSNAKPYLLYLIRTGKWKFYDRSGKLSREISYDEKGNELMRQEH